MEELYANYLALLGASVKNTAPEFEMNLEGWQDLLALSNLRKTTALCGSAVAKMHEKGLVPDAIHQAWNEYCRRIFFKETIRLQEIGRLLEEAEKRGIELLFFKGYFLACLYPGFGLRNSSDTDFLVCEEQLSQAVELLEKEYEPEPEHSKEKVYVYRHKLSGNVIEMHLQLWEDYEGKKIELLKGMGLDSKENRVRSEVFGKTFTTIEPTRHLIYQVFHVVKHFCVEGVGIRYLLDTALFAECHKDSIDWNLFWKSMKELGYTEFCAQFFSLGVKYFDLGQSALPDGKLSLPQDEEAFLMDLILAGKVSEGQKGAFQIWGIMSPYVTGEIQASHSKIGRAMQTLFPSAENIRDDFAYAKKYKFLLPIAWVHRIFDYLRYRRQHPDASYSVDEKFDAAEYRVNQLRKRGLT